MNPRVQHAGGGSDGAVDRVVGGGFDVRGVGGEGEDVDVSIDAGGPGCAAAGAAVAG